jgi:hypothetical protein
MCRTTEILMAGVCLGFEMGVKRREIRIVYETVVCWSWRLYERYLWVPRRVPFSSRLDSGHLVESSTLVAHNTSKIKLTASLKFGLHYVFMKFSIQNIHVLKFINPFQTSNNLKCWVMGPTCQIGKLTGRQKAPRTNSLLKHETIQWKGILFLKQ